MLDQHTSVESAEDKLVLKQRLASLMTPEGMDRNELKHQQLRLIDSYLLTESGKATLKSAIEQIKPFYVQYLDQMLAEAGQQALTQMGFSENKNDAAFIYFLH